MEKEYEWTIMLYLAGDNNLSEEMIRALIDLSASGGVPEKVALTIQYDPWSPGFPTALYAIPRKQEVVALPPLEQLLPIPQFFVAALPNEDSSDPRTLAEFIRWSARTYPSKYRMLILSGHGNGAVGDFLNDDNERRSQPGSLTIPRLAKAFELARQGDETANEDLREPLPPELLRSGDEPEGKPEPCLLHILGMDSCLMGMAEVCHEIGDSVEYLVGSEGFVPNAGWPYAYLRRQLVGRKDRRPESMVSWIVEDVLGYYNQYLAGGVSFDVAACELARLPDLAARLQELTAVLLGRLEDPCVRDAIVIAHWRTQSYKFEQHSDLWDFCDQLKGLAERDAPDGLAALCEAVKTSIDQAVVCNGHTGSEFQHSHGLSVYFPWSASPYETETLRHYSRLSFPERSGWSKFLPAYLKETQRKPLALARPDAPDLAPVPVQRLMRRGPLQAHGAVRAAQGANRAAQGANRAADGASQLIMKLYSGAGITLPGSMKNPPSEAEMIPGSPVIRRRENKASKQTSVEPPKHEPAPKAPMESPTMS